MARPSVPLMETTTASLTGSTAMKAEISVIYPLFPNAVSITISQKTKCLYEWGEGTDTAVPTIVAPLASMSSHACEPQVMRSPGCASYAQYAAPAYCTQNFRSLNSASVIVTFAGRAKLCVSLFQRAGRVGVVWVVYWSG